MYIVIDQSGRVWKSFATDKEANDYVRGISGFTESALTVQYIEKQKETRA